MNTQQLIKAGIDYDDGVKRFLGKAQLYEKVLCKLPEDGTFDRIRQDRAAGDDAALLRDAHELKGVCGNLAVTRLYTACDALVVLLRSGAAAPSEVEAGYRQLEAAYLEACATIRDWEACL